MPPEGSNFLSYRAGLTMMLAVAVTGAPDCRTARELIGLHPSHPSDLHLYHGCRRLPSDGDRRQPARPANRLVQRRPCAASNWLPNAVANAGVTAPTPVTMS